MFEYLNPPLVYKTSRERKFMKRENFKDKILERESEERKSLYPSYEIIMIKIIRDYIKVTQYGLIMIDIINFE